MCRTANQSRCAALTFGYALNILALHYGASEVQTGILQVWHRETYWQSCEPKDWADAYQPDKGEEYKTDLLWNILITDIQAHRSPRYLELCVISLAGTLGVLASCTEILAMDGVTAWREVTNLLPLESGIPEDLKSDDFRQWHDAMLNSHKVKTVLMNFSAVLFYLQYLRVTRTKKETPFG